MIKLHLFLIVSMSIIIFLQPSFADTPIKITISSDMDKIIFDGKWTHTTEWKRSSLDTLAYSEYNEQIKLRTAHQGNFVYILIDFVSDITPTVEKDYAVVCFDTMNDKNNVPNSDDVCFLSILGQNEGIVLQGNSNNDENLYQEISSPDGFIAISTESDEADRYSEVPHSTYEFKIPTDFITRQSIYGFYVGVYDSEMDKTFSWPINVESGQIKIPNPNLWGEMISPDKTLPEFEWPLLMMLPILTLIIYITKKSKFFKNEQ